MEKLVVKKSIEVNAPASKVWEVVSSPGAWKRWMLVVPEVEGDGHLKLGSKVLWKDEHGKAYLTGTVTALEANQRLVLDLQDVSWTRKAEPGEVTYALTLLEANGRTSVAFALGDLSIDPEAKQWYDAYAESQELEVIKEMAESSASRSQTQ
jgi:uncharacterized protein YndB with AHSA1/START domain